MSDIIIKKGYVIDPSQDIEGIYDILIIDGKIAKIEPDIPTQGQQVINALGLVVTPGFVDMHVHLRDPGQTHKEDIFTGCKAAVAGGVTSVLCMPNTTPVIDNQKTIEYINQKSSTAKANVYVCASMTNGLKGQQIADYDMYKSMQVKAVSDDGRPVENDQMMKKAMLNAKANDLLAISHCEDLKIIDGGIIHKGCISEQLGIKGMDRLSEDNITKREIEFAQELKSRIHIAHVSTKASTQYIREAKAKGIEVTAETCPHYFVFTHEKLLLKDADYRMNPPLREQEDINAIIEGIKDGTFDCIVTDHAPHAQEEKQDFYNAPNGVVGIETSFAAANTFLVEKGHISLGKLIKLMSTNPAKILGLNAGSLAVGKPADIAIIDTALEWTVASEKLHSKSKNCVFKNQHLKGKVVKTIVNGKVVYNLD